MAQVGLSSSLTSLLGALKTAQTSLASTSDNIANVNTIGYTRRIVLQEAQYTAGEGVGVNVGGIRRSVDEFLLKAVRAQLSKVGEASVRSSYFDKLQQFTFGDPNSQFTMTNSLNTFYTRLQSFASDTSSAIQRNLVITSAKNFSTTVNDLAKNIQTERFNVDNEIGDTVTSINNILNNLYDINGAIRQSVSVDGDLNSLYDARDVQLNNLKQLIDVNFSFDVNGQVSVSTSSAELLGFSTKYRIDYATAGSVDNFINNGRLGAITVIALNSSGDDTNNVNTLLSASDATKKIDNVPDGKLRGLIDLRDTELPKMLDQLDNFAFTYANQFNEIHNGGTGYPPAETLTGNRALSLSDTFSFSGSTRFTLTTDTGAPPLDKFGRPMPPLLIDFSRLNGSSGFGTSSVQDIIDEINSYYGTQPASEVDLGPANDIRLGAISSSITSVKSTGSIAFSGQPSPTDNLVINGTTVTFVASNPTGNEVLIGSTLNSTLENLKSFLNTSNDTNISAATYDISGSSLTIEAKNAGTNGNSITLNASGTSVATASGATLSGGADASGNFTFDFDFANLSPVGNNITFDVTQIKVNGGAATPVTFNTYTQNAGVRARTDQAGTSNDSLTVDLTGLGLQEGSTFTITATIQVDDGNGNLSNEDVTFTVTVPDPTDDIKNNRYAATAISGTGDGQLNTTSNTAGFLTASLVDSNGAKITDPNTDGYLKIDTANSSYRISVDQLDSKENGQVGIGGADATGYGFSHFFGLNDFFTFGGQQKNSALNLAVRSDIVSNPALLSGGKTIRSTQTSNDNVYTYEIGSGSNESALELAATQDQNITFAAAGDIPQIFTSVNFYASEIYSYAANKANDAKSEADKNDLLNNSLQTKVDDISGVNIDQELGLTIQIQNSYAAAAKVLGVVKELFQKIEDVLTT